MESLGVCVIVVLILAAVATSGIERQVVDGLRCGVGRIFGSWSGCGAASLAGGAIGGGTVTNGRSGPVARADSLPPPAGYAMYIARLDTYCSGHPHQRFHPGAPGLPWISCASYDRARRAMQGTGSVQKCVHNVLVGAGLGMTRGLFVALKDGDVGASIADVLEIVGRGSLEGAAQGGVAGAALACLYGIAGG